MNYIEFEIGNKSRGFKFGLGFLGDVLDYLDTDLAGFGEMMTKNPFKCIPLILYFAHKRDLERKEQPIDFKLIDVEDWVDDIGNGFNNDNIVESLRIVIKTIQKHLPKAAEQDGKGEKKN